MNELQSFRGNQDKYCDRIYQESYCTNKNFQNAHDNAELAAIKIFGSILVGDPTFTTEQHPHLNNALRP